MLKNVRLAVGGIDIEPDIHQPQYRKEHVSPASLCGCE
jgi:hypothetical protein